jgi:hypothetical protein
VTNTSSTTALNTLDTYSGGSGPSALYAVGGNTVNRLPYPFNWATIAASGSLQMPMHPRDWRYKRTPFSPQEAGEAWQQGVLAGKFTMSFASETGRRDEEELFVTAV